MGKNIKTRILAIPKSLCNGCLTIISGSIFLGFGGMAIITLPTILIPICCCILMIPSAAITVYFGSMTQHEMRIACGSNKKCHSRRHASKIGKW